MRRIFGIPGGGAVMHLIDAAADEGIAYTLTNHETTAAIASSVYWEQSGTPTACSVIMGPGITHAMHGAAYAFLERSPMLLLSSRQPDAIYEQTLSQRLSHPLLAAAVAKRHMDMRPDNAAHVANAALRIATQEPPGPVFVDMANDAHRVTVGQHGMRREEPARHVLFAQGAGEGLFEASRIVSTARRPLLLAGRGVVRARAGRALQALAEAWQAPVFTTLKAKDALPADHPWFAGTFAGAPFELELIGAADLIVVLGADAGEFAPGTLQLPAPVFDLSPYPREDEVYAAAYERTGAIAEAIDALGSLSPGGAWDFEMVAAYRRHASQALDIPATGLSVPAAVQLLRRWLPPDGIVACDVGLACAAAAHLWPASREGTFHVSKGLSTMGYAIPAAIGAQLADPKRRVLALSGDGSVLMRLGEIETMVREKLPVTIVAFTDQELGLIRVKQKQQKLPAVGVRFHADLRLDLTAEALGAASFLATTERELDVALAQAAQVTERPVLIQVAVDRPHAEELVGRIRG